MSVYFARREKLIKIGWSRNVHVRIDNLGAELIGFIPGDRATESKIHDQFKHLRAAGEWFNESEDLLGFIREEMRLNQSEPDSENIQTALRLPVVFLKRIDKIAERISKSIGIKITRAEALRRAACIGAEHLESEYK